MEEKIVNALLEMYISNDFEEIASPDSAFICKNDIIESYRADLWEFGEEEALNNALNSAISLGNSEGFVNGLRVGRYLRTY